MTSIASLVSGHLRAAGRSLFLFSQNTKYIKGQGLNHRCVKCCNLDEQKQCLLSWPSASRACVCVVRTQWFFCACDVKDVNRTWRNGKRFLLFRSIKLCCTNHIPVHKHTVVNLPLLQYPLSPLRRTETLRQKSGQKSWSENHFSVRICVLGCVYCG